MTVQTNLFGEEQYIPPTCNKRGRNEATPRGHIMPPGTGPEGETCRGCKHKVNPSMTKKAYLKCKLNSARWTCGRKTDILARDPACKKWEKK